MERTRIIELRITVIGEDSGKKLDEKEFVRQLKDILNVDDVVVDKVQDFIMDKAGAEDGSGSN